MGKTEKILSLWSLGSNVGIKNLSTKRIRHSLSIFIGNRPICDGTKTDFSKPTATRQFSTDQQEEAAFTEKLKWSYVHGKTDVCLQGNTIGRALQQRVEMHPDKEALVFAHEGIRRTFAELLDDSDKLAAGLMALGLQKGDRVAIWGPNSWEWVVTQFATARAGMVLVSVNPLYQPDEVEYVFNKVGCKALISASSFRTQDYYEILFQLIPELVNTTPGQTHGHRLPQLSTIIIIGDQRCAGTFKFSEIMTAGTNKERAAIMDLQDKLQFDEPINIQFTSGTTGSPKGATLSHHNILNNSYFTGRNVDFHLPDMRMCMPAPLFHCSGLVIGSLSIASNGTCVVFPGPIFDAGATLRAVQDERCSALCAVPTMFIDMLNHPEFEAIDFSSLYTGVMGGSACPAEVMKQVMEKMHMPYIAVVYGTTENSPVTFQGNMTDSTEKRISTVGQVAPHVEAKIINAAGELVEVGTSGEICTRGYTTMLGYWDDADQTASVIKPDRWYHTGDIGVMDEEGYCKIVGRIKDMIIRGGENIYPTEIENCLYKHPQVQDVQVIGVPDERMGEELCACVKIRDGDSATDQDIRDFCKDKLARFKVPRYVQLVQEYPLTVSGKVQKYKLREQMIHSLGLEHVKPHM